MTDAPLPGWVVGTDSGGLYYKRGLWEVRAIDSGPRPWAAREGTRRMLTSPSGRTRKFASASVTMQAVNEMIED